MKYFILSVICALFTFTSLEKSLAPNDKTYNSEGIELIINNIRNKNGVLQIGVFDSEKGYPDTPSFSFTLAKDTIASKSLRLHIPLDHTGVFGITILDDENCNKKMDFVFIIKPKEGFGFSNNPKVAGRAAPPFRDTCVVYKGGRLVVIVNMKYI